MPLSINLEDHYDYTLIEVAGKVDAGTAQMLDRAIEAATWEGNRHLVLDCSQLYSISSEGLRVLLNARSRLALYHNLAMCNVASTIQSLLDLTGVTRYIRVIPELEDAESLISGAEFSRGHIRL
ncbi:MAG: STAS domain-containing protein [Endozoicomonas sp.]